MESNYTIPSPQSLADARHNPILEARIREERRGEGILRIHETYINGEPFTSAFTLDSLAHVLGIPMSTMEGRYKRARLSKLVVNVVNGYGRPVRAFPLVLYDAVVAAIMTPNLAVAHDAHSTDLVELKPIRVVQELEPTYFLGQPYYSITALARSFGVSETTVRNKLKAAGLMRYFQNLGAPVHGGRPKRGIPHRCLGQVRLAVQDGYLFHDSYHKVLARAGGMIKQAQGEMERHVTPHTPPAPLQAWDPSTLGPVTKAPVNDVNSDEGVSIITAEIEALMAAMPPADPTPLPTPANRPAPQLETPAPAPAMMTDSEARRAQLAEEAANRAALVPVHRQQLIDAVEEPTDEELDDTCYALDLNGQARTDFYESVREGRKASGRAL